jgi:hypothetical protein
MQNGALFLWKICTLGYTNLETYVWDATNSECALLWNTVFQRSKVKLIYWDLLKSSGYGGMFQ